MWKERPTEQLQAAVNKINTDLDHISDPLRVAQYERIRETITTHLGSLSVNEETVQEFTEDYSPDSLPIGTYVHETEPLEESDAVDDAPSEDKADATTTEISPLVESGTSGIWSDSRKSKAPKTPARHEINAIERPRRPQTPERAGTEPYLIRFDPELGVYNEKGRMLADPTESRIIRQNIEVIIEVAHHLAYLSNENPVITHDYSKRMDEILADLGYDSLPVYDKNMLMRELGRILRPTDALNVRKDRQQTYWVNINHPFTFVVTDLQPRKSRTRNNVEAVTPDMFYSVGGWNDDIQAELRQKRVPTPTTHQQAIQLLDAVMHNPDFVDELERTTPSGTIQRMLDLAHTLVQETLGWNGYMHARRARTMRSGSAGFNGRIRQVTGSQRAERFQTDNGTSH